MYIIGEYTKDHNTNGEWVFMGPWMRHRNFTTFTDYDHVQRTCKELNTQIRYPQFHKMQVIMLVPLGED